MHDDPQAPQHLEDAPLFEEDASPHGYTDASGDFHSADDLDAGRGELHAPPAEPFDGFFEDRPFHDMATDLGPPPGASPDRGSGDLPGSAHAPAWTPGATQARSRDRETVGARRGDGPPGRSPGSDLTPPADLAAERVVVGSSLVQPDIAVLTSVLVKPEDFYDIRHGHVFRVATELALAGHPTEPMVVLGQLRAQGKGDLVTLGYLHELTESFGSTFAAEHFAKRIGRLAAVRRILGAAHKVTAEGYRKDVDPDTFVQLVESELGAALRSSVSDAAVSIRDVVGVVYDEVLRARERGGEIIGIPTGFRDLDRLTLGLHKTDLLILAARPAMGKTAFALNLALQVALRQRRNAEHPEDRHSVLIFSLEMGRDQLVQRLLSARSRIGLTSLRKGELTPDDEIQLRDAADELSGLRVFIDDTGVLTPTDLRARARRVSGQVGGIDLIVIDYLQLMHGSGSGRQSREQEISEISRSLKALAKELSTTVIALSQLNRSLESRPNKRPMMSDLRESGAIEQDADLIAFIYRDVVYNKEAPNPNEAELIIAKQRAGPTDTVKLYFEGRLTKFSTFDDRVDDQYAYGGHG